jgi:ATP-binding cassette subfamily B protein
MTTETTNTGSKNTGSKKAKKNKAKKTKPTGRQLLRVVRRCFVLGFKLVPRLTLQLTVVVIALELFPLVQNGLFGSIINKITEAVGNGSGAAADATSAGMAGGAASTLANGANIKTILAYILLYVVVLVIISIFQELRKYVEKRWDLTTDNELTAYSLRKRAGIDIANYEDPEFQNLINKAFDHGVWPLYTLAKGQIQNIANVFGIVTAGVIIYNISAPLLIISFLSAVPNFVIELKYGYNMWGILSENSVRQRLYYALRDHIQGRKNIIQTKMLQASEKILTTTENIMKGYLNDQLNIDRRRLWLGMSSNIIMALGIGYGLYLIVGEVLAGRILAGTLVFAVFSLQNLVTTMNNFLRDIAEQYKRALTAKDIFEVYDTVPRIRDAADPKHLSLLKPPHIEFKNVSFKYPSKNPEDDVKAPWVFKDLSFIMNAGEKIGIVGQNGAGKSTLIKLMMRVYDPTEGAILIDGTDLREISTHDWTAVLSVLLQQYSLHEFDIESAIAMGLPNSEVDSEQAIIAAKLSGADEFIQEYPKGYKQQISREFDEGIEPSQGQLQKIALARALYRLQVGQVLILDEPTAAIDPLAELEIFEQMEKATKGKTLILITHRFNSVKNVDKILVLDGHKLAEQGSHDELMSLGGIYKSMFEGQAKGFRE